MNCIRFGIQDAGKPAITVRALYSMKSAGALFRVHLAQCIQELGSYEADLDLWWKPEIRPQDKFEYYSYILCCVMNKLNGYVALKP